MTKVPRISVLMPAYNCERYIKEAIDSIVHQTFTDWELLVTDDGSSDRTRLFIDQYTDPRIRTSHNEENLGVVKTRNKLISLARGHYIVWQDADDTCTKDRLIKLLNEFEKDPELIICGSGKIRYLLFTGEKRVTYYPATHAAIRDAIKAHLFPFLGASVAVKRSALSDDLLFRELFTTGGEDPDWLLRLTEKYKSANIQEGLYIHRYSRNSLSKKNVLNDIIHLNTMKVVFFLSEQRKKNNGIDGLMDGGDKKELTNYLDQLEQVYKADHSVIYRQSCKAKIGNQDYGYAILDAIQAIFTRPDIPSNYALIFRILKSVLKTIASMFLRGCRNAFHRDYLSESKQQT